MNNMRKWLTVPMVAIGCLTLTACATTQRTARVDKAPAGMHQITALYEKATAHHVRPFRKPIRDARARTLRQLAVTTDRFIAETKVWDSDVRLTAIAAPQRDEARNAVGTFRESLRGLKMAADRSNISAVRAEYASVMASYQRVVQTTGLGD